MKEMSQQIPFLEKRDQKAVEIGEYEARGVVAIVANESGHVLLNLRDNKADILHPNRWSILGGLCELGEDDETALRRELLEEANLLVSRLIPGWRFIDWEGSRHLLTAFIVPTDVPLGEMRLGEGQDLRFFSEKEILELQVAPFVRPLMKAFFADRHTGDDGHPAAVAGTAVQP